MRASASQLSQFGGCARQFYYSRILELGSSPVSGNTVLGTVWHYAADVYETYGNDLNLAIRTFEHYWAHPEELGQHIDFWYPRTNHEMFRKRGIKMLKEYHGLAPWREGRLVGTEIKFQVPIGNHEIRGIIDKLWVLHGKKELQAIDFKTGNYIKKLRHNVQFTTYCYATTRPEFWEHVPGFEDGFERFRNYRRSGGWYHARNGKLLNAGYRTEDDYRRLLLAVDEMERAITAGVFPLDYSGESCAYCPFVEEICGAEVHLKEADWNGIELVRVGEENE